MTNSAPRSVRVNDLPVAEHFRMREFECPCCHLVRLSPLLVYLLEELRAFWGNPVLITSGFRCPSHNRRVNGAPRSLHLLGQAADVIVPFPEQGAVEVFARKNGFSEVIPYGRRNFLHLAVA